MNFFNFKRKHWNIVGIFVAFNIFLVVGFSIFIFRLHAKVVKANRESLVWTPSATEEIKGRTEKKELPVANVSNVESETCSTCAKQKEEGLTVTRNAKEAEK